MQIQLFRGRFAAIFLLLPLLLTFAYAQNRTSLAGQSLVRHKTEPKLSADFGKLPLSFAPNRGQTDPRVRFIAQNAGWETYLTSQSIWLGSGDRSNGVVLNFLGANAATRTEELDTLPGKNNYLIGNNSSKWITQVPTFATVKYDGIYSGIDVRFHGTGKQIEYDFDISPGADPKQIRIGFEPSAKVQVGPDGSATIEDHGIQIHQHPPRAYQEVNGTQHEIAIRTVLDQQELSFNLASYDTSKPVIIDPAIDYSALFGGANVNTTSNAIAVDSSGNVYLAGETNSSFPTTAGAYQASSGDSNCVPQTIHSCGDAFVMELDSTGTNVVYATFIGGNNEDIAQGIGIDSVGEAYLTGATWSTNFPVTAGGVQQHNTGGTCFNGIVCSNAFVTVLNAAGSGLVYSTYLGSAGNTSSVTGDQGNAIAIDPAGRVYVTGIAALPNFPTTPGALQTNFSSCCGAPFVSALDPTKSGPASLIYSTFLGGNVQNDRGFGASIAVDSTGEAFITGQTASTALATPGAYLTTNNAGTTGFVIKLNASGSIPVFATYLGGNGSKPWCTDQPNAIAIDAAGNSYVTGIAGTLDFPTTSGAFQTAFSGETAAFVSKLNSTGNTLLYSTLMGGSVKTTLCSMPTELGTGIAVDSTGIAYVAGRVLSPDFPITPISIQPVCANTIPSPDECGSFVAVVDPAANGANSLKLSTFLAGSLQPQASGIALDGSGKIYVTGSGGIQSGTIPVLGGPPTTGSSWVAKVDLNGSAPAAALLPLSLNFGSVAIGENQQLPITLTNRGNADLAVSNISISGSSFTQQNNCPASLTPAAACTITVTFSPTSAATQTGQLAVTDSAFDSPHFSSVNGTGGTPVATTSVSSLTFTSQPAGSTSASQAVNLSNTGTAPLTIASIATSGDFSQTNNCGSSVAAGTSCTINVVFNPTATGSRNGTLTINDDVASSPQTVLLGGTGVASALGLAIASGNSSSQTVAAGSTANYMLSIGNGGLSGTATLTCTGAPTTTVCTVPVTENVNASTAVTFPVTVSTTAHTSGALPNPGSMFWGLAFMLFGGVFLTENKNKLCSRLLKILVPFALILFVASCGGGGSNGGGGGGATGTPAGSYTLTVTATIGSNQQSTTLNLTVQ